MTLQSDADEAKRELLRLFEPVAVLVLRALNAYLHWMNRMLARFE